MAFSFSYDELKLSQSMENLCLILYSVNARPIYSVKLCYSVYVMQISRIVLSLKSVL